MTSTIGAPTLGLLAKLGTIAQIVDEATDANHVNLRLAREILADREVSQWLDVMHQQGLLQRAEQST